MTRYGLSAAFRLAPGVTPAFCAVQSAADATQQKHTFDAQLDKAQADAAEMKVAFDKVCSDVLRRVPHTALPS